MNLGWQYALLWRIDTASVHIFHINNNFRIGGSLGLL